MIERADTDNDGLVTFEDFYHIMTKKTFSWMKYYYYYKYMRDNICYYLFLL